MTQRQSKDNGEALEGVDESLKNTPRGAKEGLKRVKGKRVVIKRQ